MLPVLTENYCFSGKLEEVGTATTETVEENVGLVSEGKTELCFYQVKFLRFFLNTLSHL